MDIISRVKNEKRYQQSRNNNSKRSKSRQIQVTRDNDDMGFEYDDCIEKKDLVERCVEAHHSVNDLSVTDLKTRLDVLNVDHSQCIEKTELVRKLRRESTKRGKSEMASAVQEESATEAGWVRQIGIDGRITLVPASGQKVHGTGGVGMNIQEDDMEGAAALPFENKVR